MSGIEILKIGAVIGFILPPIIAVIIQTHWSSQVKGALAFAACLVAALAVVVYEDSAMDWHDWRNASIVVFSSAIFFYHQFWKPSGIAPAIEAKTSPNATALDAGR